MTVIDPRGRRSGRRRHLRHPQPGDRRSDGDARHRAEDALRAAAVARAARDAPSGDRRARDGEIVGWASLNPFNPRECVRSGRRFFRVRRAELARSGDRHGPARPPDRRCTRARVSQDGAGRPRAQRAGVALYTSAGFSRVGIYREQGQLTAAGWTSLIMEKLAVSRRGAPPRGVAQADEALEAVGTVPRRARLGHGARGLQRERRRLGVLSRTTTRDRARTAGTRTASPASAIGISSSASPSRSGTAAIGFSRSGSSA